MGRRAWALVVLVIAAACSTGTPSGAPTSLPSPAAATPLALPEGSDPPVALATKPPAPPDLTGIPGRIHLDGAPSGAAWIGPVGGTVTATAADGTHYVLEIPAGAMLQPTPISMTPVAAVDDVGLSGGLAGAVYLQPRGTRLAVPALLHVTTARAQPAGTQLVAFDVADDGQTDVVPALDGQDGLTAVIFHFSSPGLGWGTSEDLQRLAPPITNPLTADMRLTSNLTALYAESVPWDSPTMLTAYALVNFEWLGLIRDELADAQDDDDLVHALADWQQLVFLINLLSTRGEVRQAMADGSVPVSGPFPAPLAVAVRLIASQALPQIANRVLHAIDGNMDLCRRSHDLGALGNLSFWAAAGSRYSPQGDNSIYTQRATGCAAPAIGSFDPATNLRAGLVDSLLISYVLKFSDGVTMPADFQAALTGIGFTFASTGTPQANAGEVAGTPLALHLAGTADPPYELRANVCWWRDGLPRGLCGLVRQGWGPGPTPPPSGGPLDWTTECMEFSYRGTWINLGTPSHVEGPGIATIATPCRGQPLLLENLVTTNGGDVTQERIVFRIQGGAAGFTATEFGCVAGLPNNGCTGSTSVTGAGGASLTLTISGTKTGEALWSFSGALEESFKVE